MRGKLYSCTVELTENEFKHAEGRVRLASGAINPIFANFDGSSTYEVCFKRSTTVRAFKAWLQASRPIERDNNVLRG